MWKLKPSFRSKVQVWQPMMSKKKHVQKFSIFFFFRHGLQKAHSWRLKPPMKQMMIMILISKKLDVKLRWDWSFYRKLVDENWKSWSHKSFILFNWVQCNISQTTILPTCLLFLGLLFRHQIWIILVQEKNNSF